LAEFTEVESGKRHRNRPQLQAALDLCKKKNAKLVIAKLDRLSRNVAFISALIESGVQFVCCDNPHANKAMLQMMAVFAEFEREQISQRTKAALARVKTELLNGPRISQAGREYRKLGGPNLAKACERAAEIRRGVEPPAYVIDMMREIRLAGHSYERIAAELNNRCVKTPQGFRWYASTARAVFLRLITDAADPYAGAIDHIYEGLNEPMTAAIPSVVPSNAGREATTEGKPPMQNIIQALQMLDTFASVGARRFDVTFLNMEGEKRGFRPQQSLIQVRNSLPKLLPGLTERQNSLVVRPSGDDVQFIQLDDLDTAALERLQGVAFLTLATSPGNHQAWVAVQEVQEHRKSAGDAGAKELARRLRKGVGADISASGATRLAGAVNYKAKYAPNFPTVSVVSAFPGRLVTAEQLKQLGLLAEPEPVKAPPLRVSHSGSGRTWPDYARCVASAPPNNAKDGPDISRADFTWALMALRRGQTIEDTAARLTELSSKAKENREGYALRTARNAAAAVERERLRARA